MRSLLTALFFVWAGVAFAQTENLDAKYPRLNEGQIFTIQFAPVGRKLTVSLAGKPGVELAPGKVLVFGREILRNGKERKLEIRPSGQKFEIAEPSSKDTPVEIEIRDPHDTGKKEVFRLESTP